MVSAEGHAGKEHVWPNCEASAWSQRVMAATTGTLGKYGMQMPTAILDGEEMFIDDIGKFLLYCRKRCTWDMDAFKHEDFRTFERRLKGR